MMSTTGLATLSVRFVPLYFFHFLLTFGPFYSSLTLALMQPHKEQEEKCVRSNIMSFFSPYFFLSLRQGQGDIPIHLVALVLYQSPSPLQQFCLNAS